MCSHSKQTCNRTIVLNINLLSCWHFWQTRHSHDVSANYNDETSTVTNDCVLHLEGPTSWGSSHSRIIRERRLRLRHAYRKAWIFFGQFFQSPLYQWAHFDSVFFVDFGGHCLDLLFQRCV